ncbi:hypothetical protein MHUMG1_00811 [Metarhizium humberi]|uniref:WW domain-containing protein n=1 Tax=Metarhizium humberi TaxID=2596975 RepID=A0A9P8MLE9_9HYPO|nr:hypothetical protein MHUMG1_00811 [Metarhizium humberi]
MEYSASTSLGFLQRAIGDNKQAELHPSTQQPAPPPNSQLCEYNSPQQHQAELLAPLRPGPISSSFPSAWNSESAHLPPPTPLPPPYHLYSSPTSLPLPLIVIPRISNENRTAIVKKGPMAGPTSPSNEGPSFAPPQLPPGWIAQWDGASKKYYYVQLATGVSQWEIPTQAAKTGTTPGQAVDHPYGTPPPELITHPDGSQTVKHPDGTMEPIMADGTRGVDGPSGDRGLGTMAMNALLGGKKQSSGGGSGIGGLASQFLGGSSSGHGGGSSGIAGKLAGQLASNLFSPSDKPEPPQNYHGGQNSSKPSHQGGIAGAVFGGVAHMFGGKESSGNQNYGYSNTGAGSYAGGDAPTYHPPGSTHSSSAPKPPSNTSSTPNQQHHSQGSQGHQSQGHQSHGSQSYPPPPPPPQGHSPNQQSNYQSQAPPHDTYQGASFPGQQQQHNQPPYGQNYNSNSSSSGVQYGGQHGGQGGYSGGQHGYGGQQQQQQQQGYGQPQHQGGGYNQQYSGGNQSYQGHQQYQSGHY